MTQVDDSWRWSLDDRCPAARPPELDRLDLLVGEWEMEAAFEAGYVGRGGPPVTLRRGRTAFEWLDGRFFLV